MRLSLSVYFCLFIELFSIFVKQVKMAPVIDRSYIKHNAAKPMLLTMDVIELTLLLKSIGFRLNSIDFDEQHFAAKTNGDGVAANGAGTSPTAHQQADTGDHFINVQISCSKSEIVSQLSLKLSAEHKATDAATVEPSKCTAACTCPKREKHDDNNSFWEVQSSGTFANRRRSMNALLLDSDKGIENDTSSNLLPILSAKSVALTQVLTQVLLNQYKINSRNGENASVKNFDVKSIMTAINYGDVNGKHTEKPIDVLPGKSRKTTEVADLTLPNIIEAHNGSANVENGNGVPLVIDIAKLLPDIANVEVNTPKLLLTTDTSSPGPTTDPMPKTVALNETINTEAFSSPKSDMFTSSPNSSHSSNTERDANLISNLNQARQLIDSSLLLMKLNITQNISHGSVYAGLLTVTPQNRRPFASTEKCETGPKLPTAKPIDRTVTKTASVVRRASICGSIGRASGVTTNANRLNTTSSAPGIAERSLTQTKLSMTRRGVSGIAARSTNSPAATNKPPNPITNPVTARIAATQKLQRRVSSPSMLTPNALSSLPGRTGLRRSVGVTSSIPSKLAKK